MTGDFVKKREYNHTNLVKYLGQESEPVLPKNIGRIGKGAFENNRFITSIEIPNTAEIIRKNAFRGCINLKSVKMNGDGGYYLYIDDSAFEGCTGLNNLTFPEDGSVVLGSSVFSGCVNLANLFIPNGIFQGARAFEGCTSLTSVTINGYFYYSRDTFIGCENLKYINYDGEIIHDFSEF